jgi:PPP family 3-phenylpropionic acid transporter
LFAVVVSPGLVLVIQLLNGLTFPATWTAGVAYADENAPPGMSATDQGLFSATVLGFGTAVGDFIAGLLLDSIGGQGLFITFGAAVLTIVGLVALLQKRLPADGQTPSIV